MAKSKNAGRKRSDGRDERRGRTEEKIQEERKEKRINLRTDEGKPSKEQGLATGQAQFGWMDGINL